MKKQTFYLSKTSIALSFFVLFAQHPLGAQIPQSLPTAASDAPSTAPHLSKIQGVWLTQKDEKNAKVQIAPCAEDAKKFCGKIVWLESPTYEDGTPKTDRHNQSSDKQNSPLLGLELLSNFTQLDETSWGQGVIYNPEDGDTYNCEISYTQNDGQEKLKVRGYVGISLFGKTQTWVRSSN